MKTSDKLLDTPELDLELRKQEIAYQLWEDEGRPEGKAEEHWAKACLVVMSLAEGDTLESPTWLKRQNVTPENVTTPELPDTVEKINKRVATRHAA